MEEKKIPRTLEEAYRLRDSAVSVSERDYYQEHVRLGKPPKEAYYLSRVIALVGEAEFRNTLENIRRSGYPKGQLSYSVEKSAIQVRDLPGGMILIHLTFFASLFAFVWATGAWDQASRGTIIFIGLGLVATGLLMLISAVFIVTLRRSINK